jgi:hypothetical protein
MGSPRPLERVRDSPYLSMRVFRPLTSRLRAATAWHAILSPALGERRGNQMRFCGHGDGFQSSKDALHSLLLNQRFHTGVC